MKKNTHFFVALVLAQQQQPSIMVTSLRLQPQAIRMATSYSYSDERRMLRGVLSEAMKAQERTREALEEQLKPRTSPSKTLDPEANEKLLVKAQRRAERVPSRIAEVEAFGEKLADLQQRLKKHSSREAVASLRKDMETHSVKMFTF